MSEEKQLTKVVFRDDDGKVETLWAFDLGGNFYQLDNTPWYHYGVSWKDVIEAVPESGGELPLFRRVVEKSGYRTLRVALDEPATDVFLEDARALPPDENPLPPSGVLSFFYDAYDQPWGHDPEDRHDFRVIYSGPAEELLPATPPEDLPEVCRFAQRAASLHRKPSLPSDRAEEIYALRLTDQEDEGYLAFRSARHNNPSRTLFSSGLLGYPDAVQDARMEVECELLSHGIDPEVYWGPIRAGGDPSARIAALAEGAKGAWRLLLQLDADSESGMEWWYDTGMLYFWVTERGLGEEDFDEVWVLLQTT